MCARWLPGASTRPTPSTKVNELKITGIKLRRLRLPLDPPFHAAWDQVPRAHFDATVVRVETDEGIVGLGSGDTMDGFEPYVELVIGKNPMHISRHVRVIETINFHAGRYWPLEAALWDIIRQVTGQPVSVLFGGASDALPAYASTGEVKPPAERAESALALRELGFKALKGRFVRERPADGVAAGRAVRKAVGSTPEILVSLNQARR